MPTTDRLRVFLTVSAIALGVGALNPPLGAAQAASNLAPIADEVETTDTDWPDGIPTPADVTKSLAGLSDDEILAYMDAAAEEAERTLDDPETPPDAIEGTKEAIAKLRDPAERKAWLGALRDLSAEEIAERLSAVRDVVDDDPLPTIFPEIPAEVPPIDPEPSPPVWGGTNPPIEPIHEPGGPFDHYDPTALAALLANAAEWEKFAWTEVVEPPLAGKYIEINESCTGVNIGTRSAPPPSVTAGTIFTPTTDTFASSQPIVGQSRPVWTAPGLTQMGNLTTRWVNGVEEVLIEANVFSPAASFFPIGFLRPYVTVTQLDGTSLTRTPDDSGVDVLCYVEDTGVMNPIRGYVRAWFPATVLAAPGVQVRVVVADRTPPQPRPPDWFLGADLATVHIGPRPLGARQVLPNALGLVVDDSVVVDTNGNPGDDLEGILAPTLSDAITRGINESSLPQNAVSWVDLPLAGWVTVRTSAVTKPVTTDLWLSPVAGEDDERMVTAHVKIGEASFRGSFNGLATLYRPCYYRHDWYSEHTGVEFVVDVDAKNRRRLHPRTATEPWADIRTRKWGLTNGSWARPWCHFIGAFVRSGMKAKIGTKIKDSLRESFNAGPKSKFDEILGTIDLTKTMETGIQFGNGNGVVFPTVDDAGWMRTCTHWGCQGGDVSLVAEGLEGGLAVNAADRKPGGRPFRFPLVATDATAPSADDLLRTHTDVLGQPFSVGVVLHQGALNQLLRAVTEGSAGPDPAQPALAPNGILDLEQTAGGLTFRASPTVAPRFVPFVRDPANPLRWPGTIWIPDVRIRVNIGLGWDNPLVLSVTLRAYLDAQSISNQTIDPTFEADPETQVLRCPILPTWGACGTGGALAQGVNGIVQQLIVNLNQSLTNITVPAIRPDLALGAVRMQRRGAHLAVYANVYPQPRVSMSSWYNKPWYGFDAAPVFPPGPALTYEWEVRDLLAPPTNNLVWTGTTTTPNIVRHMDGLYRVRVRPPGLFHHSRWMRAVRARVIVRQAGLVAVGSRDMTMITEIW